VRRAWTTYGTALLLIAMLVGVGSPGALAAHGTSASDVPPSVTRFLQSIAQPGSTPSAAGSLIAGSVRLRVQLSSAQFGDLAVYVGRARHGVCWVMLRGDRPSGECSGDNVPAGSLVVIGFDANPAGWNLVDGHTYSPKARSLRVRFKHGSTIEVPVSGRFFAFELGLDHSARSLDPPVSLDVLDASGKILGTRVDPLHLRIRATPGVSSGG
jgi:hypothetical protein